MQNLRARLWPPGQPSLRTLGWAAVVGLIALAMLAPASPALSNDTPGNNGTVKIHEDDTENDPGEVRNEPHVCTFHLHFYFSDPEQAGTWEIQEWSPGDKGTVVLPGTYDTKGDGEDREPDQGVYSLDPGHYKLFWDGDLDTEKHDKMKVFWVDCETTSTTTETTTTTPTTTETTTTTETPTTTTETSSVSETTESTTSSPTTTSSTTTTETPTTSETSSVSETTTGSETSSTTETTTTESPTTTESTTTTETPTTSETSSVSETTTESTTTTETPTTTESTTTTETPTTTESTTITETPTTTESTSTTTSFSQTVSGTTTESTSTSTSFSQTVSGTTTSGVPPTQPNTATAENASPAVGGGIGSLLIAAFAFLVGSFLVLAPARRKNRS